MGIDASVEGVAELEHVGRLLKQVGDKDLRKELLASLRQATKPLKDAAKQSALQKLPSRGGLNRVIGGAKLGQSNRMSGRNPGVRITGKLSGHDLDAIDRGTVRHPTFGRAPWVSQSVPSGWFTEPMEDNADKVRKEIVSALDVVARKLANG